MADLGITFEWFGEVQIDRILSGVADNVEDLRPPFFKIQDALEDIERQQFRSEGSAGGTPWAPLSPRYAAVKARRFPGMKILHATGRLEDSLTNKGHADAIREVKKLSLRFGSRVPYGKFHHSREPRGSNLPRRPVIQTTEGDRQFITREIQRHVMAPAQRFGRSIG